MNMSQTRQKKDKKKPQKKFYHFRLFWIIVFISLATLFVAIINVNLNDKDKQVRMAEWIHNNMQVKLDFDNIHFNLFTGKLTGADLNVQIEKNKLNLSLKEFRLHYNPLYLWIGRFKITRIDAKEFWLDTSQMLNKKGHNDNQSPIKIPGFLKRIKLTKANIDQFFWNQSGNKQLAIEQIKIDSKFGSTFYTSPISMTISNLRYFSKKIDVFVDRIEQEGFFIFDLTQPRILDESRISIKLNFKNLLLSIYKTPKPWLTDRGWDLELETLLKMYFPITIPTDHSYQFVTEANLDVEKNQMSTVLKNLDIDIHNAHIVGNGLWQEKSHQFNLKLKTNDPISLSKMPLGQSKFRQSFNKFSVDLDLKGKLVSLKDNAIQVKSNIKLIDNLVNPPAGDISASLNGKITNGVLNFDQLDIDLDHGTLHAQGNLELEKLNTNTHFTAKQMDGQTIVRLFSSINIPSKIDASGTITGKVNDPRISIDMTTDNATYEFLNFGSAHGSLLIENKNMQLSVHSSGSTMGLCQMEMDVKNIYNSLEQNLSMKSTYKDIDVMQLLDSPALKGTISGRFDLQRIRTKLSADGDFTANQFTFFDHPIGDIKFKTDVKQKHLEVKPITVDLINPKKTILSAHGLVFDFDDDGYKFSGQLIDTLKTSGHFQKASHDFIQLEFTPQKMNLDLFASLLPFNVDDSSLTGKVNLKYNIYDPKGSQMKSQMTELKIMTPDGPFNLLKPGELDYNQKAFIFKNLPLQIGQGQVTLNGTLGLENNSAFQIKGDVDFSTIVDFNPFISESEKAIQVDVTLKDNIFLHPRVYGKIKFANDVIQFRKVTSEMDEINGTLVFDGNRITFQDMKLNFDDAPVKLKGYITTDYEKITGADLKIVAREVPIHPFDGLSLLADIDLAIQGTNQIKMSGKMNIVEGLYHQNYSITNFIVKPSESILEDKSDTLAGLPKNTIYDIQIKNTGDFMVKNNLANVEMNADLNLTGTIEKSEIVGYIEFISGQINAFGVSFDNAKGFARFKKRGNNVADINLTAINEIQGYTIYARMDGQSENLRLRLDSSPALDQREILSVMFYGQTPDQLTDVERNNFTQTAAISQLASILAAPLNKFSGLDVLEVSSRRESYKDITQRLAIGKSLSDRFSLSFTTDLATTDPERAFELRYQLLDNLYLRVAKDIVGTSRYRFDINYRFETY